MAGPKPKTCAECGQVPTAVHDGGPAAGASPDGRTEGSQASREGFALNWLLAELRTLHARWISEGKTVQGFAEQLNQVANYLLLEASERGD